MAILFSTKFKLDAIWFSSKIIHGQWITTKFCIFHEQNFVEIILWMCEWKQNLYDLNNSGKLASEMGLDGLKRPAQMSNCATNILQQHTEYQTSNMV